MKLLDDTTPEARRGLIEAYRHISGGRRWELLGDAHPYGRLLPATRDRLRHPTAADLDISLDYLPQGLGEKYARLFPEGTAIMLSPEQSRVVLTVVAAFNQLKIPYALGGSSASSIHGVRRSTEDADITVEPFSGREAEFAAKFGSEFYAD